MTFKPMLSVALERAEDGTFPDLRFPVMVSPKLDGVRCIILNGVAVSRNLKPIKNQFVQSKLAKLPDGIDGELIVGAPTGEDVWNRTNSGVMRSAGQPGFTFHVFDYLQVQAGVHGKLIPFFDRLAEARAICARRGWPCEAVKHHQIHDLAGLDYIEDFYVNEGYEGVMLRDPKGHYKFGKSTLTEGGLLKLKRWHDAEATVIGFVERMHNGNEATIDALGRTKRSSAKDGKTGRGDLGALVCEFNGAEFEIGTGFSDAQRAELWDNQASYLGSMVTFKYQQLSEIGVPRFPVFKGFRHSIDLPVSEKVRV